MCMCAFKFDISLFAEWSDQIFGSVKLQTKEVLVLLHSFENMLLYS